jgi:hypothetical protein
VAAVQARVKVVNLLAAYFAAVANYRAVLGFDAPDARGGAVLPNADPVPPRPEPPPDPAKLPDPKALPDPATP